MHVRLVFGLSALMSLFASGLVTWLYVWPWLRGLPRHHALQVLLVPHTFLRFIGLSLLVPGVVSPSLPPAFAAPAAYGDLVAGVLACAALVAMSRRASWAILLVWLFNVWGSADLLNAVYEGNVVGIDPGALGAAFFIATAVMPPLLVMHLLTFRLLLRSKS